MSTMNDANGLDQEYRIAIHAEHTACRTLICWDRSKGPGLRYEYNKASVDVNYWIGTEDELIERATKQYHEGCADASKLYDWQCAKRILDFFNAIPEVHPEYVTDEENATAYEYGE